MNEQTTLQKFQELGADEELIPIEQLRFFCQLALKSQDWLDVERFFDNVAKELSAMKQRVEAAEASIKALQWVAPVGEVLEFLGDDKFVVRINRPTNIGEMLYAAPQPEGVNK